MKMNIVSYGYHSHLFQKPYHYLMACRRLLFRMFFFLGTFQPFFLQENIHCSIAVQCDAVQKASIVSEFTYASNALG